MIDRLKKIIETTDSRAVSQVVKSDKELYNWVLAQTPTLTHTVTIKERIHCIVNNDTPICKNGKTRRYYASFNKYLFCGQQSSNCVCFKEHREENPVSISSQSKEFIVKKRKETWLKKYGADNPAKISSIIEKRRTTMSDASYKKIYKKLQHDKETVGYQTVVDRVKVHQIFLEKNTPDVLEKTFIVGHVSYVKMK